LKDQQFFKFAKNRDRVFRVFKRHFNGDTAPDKARENCLTTIKACYVFLEDSGRDVPDYDGADFWDRVMDNLGKLKPFYGETTMGFLYEIVIGLLYPKIDAHVSAQTNHLLKGPFNIHSGSGLVSVPLSDPASFNYNECPTVQQILMDKTLLEPYLKTFNDFLKKLNEGKKVESTFYNQLKRERADRVGEF